jgi:transcriptional regulator with XRE-family HTH domain
LLALEKLMGGDAKEGRVERQLHGRNGVKAQFGALIREWRRRRGISQLELAARANSSQRHVSFLESGRSLPSRATVLALTEALDLPLRARNEILLAAGFAPLYPDRRLAATELAPARSILARMLAHHEPYPAIVLDLGWNVQMLNRAAAHLVRACIPHADPGGSFEGVNLLRLMCDAQGMRPRIASWARTGPALVARLRREAADHPGSQADRLLQELMDAKAFPPFGAPEGRSLEPTIPLELRLGESCLRLVNTLTTFGTPQDVALQELRVEMSFPADDASDRLLHAWAQERGTAAG